MAGEQKQVKQEEQGPIYVESQFGGPHTIAVPSRGANGGFIRLLPGVNKVDRSDWAHAADNEMTKIYQTKKGGRKIRVLGALALEALSEDEAVELIEKTVAAPVLKSWRNQEKRDEVIEALDAQLRNVDPRQKD